MHQHLGAFPRIILRIGNEELKEPQHLKSSQPKNLTPAIQARRADV